MEKITFKDLGCISYRDAWDLQQSLMDGLIRDKLELRQLAKAGTLPEMTPVRNHQLLFCEHRPVFTLGKSGSADHLLMSAPALEELGFEFFKINRGGDITYHGPGQLVAYPIFDLDGFFSDVHRYVRYLEEVVIRTLSTYGLAGVRSDGFTGVWLEPDGNRPMRKICAIGVHLSRWVTMHGFAFNVNTNLMHFDYIVPCGIADPNKTVTSLQAELGHEVAMDEVKAEVKRHFEEVFGFAWAEAAQNS